MEEIMVKIENVSKQYRLGQIGGTTLRDELQRLHAKLHHKPDPTKKIGAKDYNRGEKFMALNGVSFEVRKGERVGIIGHNGAGKSTLLKLLSRVTAPTTGTISLNGRIASMLEVGTGFHGELTGRENVYMNGAILGMTKKEIDAKMDDIIKFAEMEKFIDTPVKRYSSGMYVKLAFSVAAHLDSEIMVMDEVLAVGDAKFQEKCLGKMDGVSKSEGRTILYVSHNMATIRQLCTRCVVLNHGTVVFDGDVEEAISIYLGIVDEEKYSEKDLTDAPRYLEVKDNRKASFTHVKFLGKTDNVFEPDEVLRAELTWSSEKVIEHTCMRFVFWSTNGTAIASSLKCDFIKTEAKEDNKCICEIPLKELTRGRYEVTLVLFEKNQFGSSDEIDVVKPAFMIKVNPMKDIMWSHAQWGRVRLPDFTVVKE